MAEHNFKLNIDIPDDAYIYADIDQIKQVIVNLITNAMNVMENDGTVTVNFQEKDGKTNIMISDSGREYHLKLCLIYLSRFLLHQILGQV